MQSKNSTATQTSHTVHKETLAKACALFADSRTPLAPEIITIRSSFLSWQNLLAFQDDALYLSFIKNLINERLNVSFPEEATLYKRYFNDCIRLKEVEQSLPGFNSENYLSDTLHMLENLKTPYYSTYFRTLLALKQIFTDSGILSRTLSDFYSLMIKTSPKKLPLITLIAEQGHFYRTLHFKDDEIIRGLMIANLSDIASKDDTMSINSLQARLQKESAFLSELQNRHLLSGYQMANLLAERMMYMEDATEALPLENELATLPPSQIVDSEFLNHYAYNMNARHYVTDPAIGREAEIKDLSLILISPKKSPILIGEAGVGKTSVVEGLAYAMKNGNVPDLLKNKKIFKLTTTSLLSGTKYVGEMEERMKKLMDELAQHPDVILFIDEIHTIVGAGSTENSNNDISNMLKPYIDRGDIKLVGATTSAEYHRFIKYDQALSRRFYPILVEEPNQELCLKILMETIPSISHETNVANPFTREETEKLLTILLDLSTSEHQPSDLQTHWPELPLSILEMAFSYAALESRTQLTVNDFIHAVSHSNRLNKETKLKAGEYFTNI